MPAEFGGEVQRQRRHAQELPPHQHHIRGVVDDGALGLARRLDQSDGRDRNADVPAHFAREAELIAGADAQLLIGVQAGAGDVEQIDAVRLQADGELHELVDVPALRGPVARREPHEQRHALGDRPSHRVDDLQQESGAVLEDPP